MQTIPRIIFFLLFFIKVKAVPEYTESTVVNSDGSVYKGHVRREGRNGFYNDLKHGHGVMTWPEGSDRISFTGEWQDNKPRGHGVMIFSNGDQVEAIFEADCTYGRALKSYANGDSYDGEFDKNEKRHGHGVMAYANGEKYEGEWDQNKKNGHGVFIYENGDKYDGKWKNNKKDGHGVMIYANGDSYDGNFVDDMRKGSGIMTYANGEKYEGEWDKNSRNGHGVHIYKNKDKYDGNWKNNKRHGHGEMTYADHGGSLSGEWQDDKDVRSRKLENSVKDVKNMVSGDSETRNKAWKKAGMKAADTVAKTFKL